MPPLLYRGKRLYGPSPEDGAQRRAGAFTPEEDSVVLIPSPLHGYGVELVLDRLPASSVLVAVEFEPELYRLSRSAPESRLPVLESTHRNAARMYFMHTPHKEQALSALLSAIPHSVRRVQKLTLNNGYSLHPDAYRELHQALEDELARRWRNKATTLALGPLWVRNLFRNLPLLTSTPQLAGPSKTGSAQESLALPVLVLGAGPSLEADISIIRELRDDVFIVAADSAAMPLIGHGVLPDLVVVLEAQAVNREHFLLPAGAGAGAPAAAAACDLSSFPSLLRSFSSTGLLLFVTRFAEISLFDRLAVSGVVAAPLKPLGSVGASAIYLATVLGSHPVGISGFDSAYTGGLPHTRGAASHRWALRRCNRLNPEPLFAFRHNRRPFPVRGKNGVSYLSEPNLVGSAQQIRELMRSNERLFDFGSQGLELGRRVESTTAAARAALHLHEPKTPQPSMHTRTHSISPQTLRTFIHDEIALLTRAIDELTQAERRLAGSSAGSAAGSPPSADHSSAPADSAVSQLEYLYFDVSSTPPGSSAARRRALLQAYRYRELLQNAELTLP